MWLNSPTLHFSKISLNFHVFHDWKTTEFNIFLSRTAGVQMPKLIVDNYQQTLTLKATSCPVNKKATFSRKQSYLWWRTQPSISHGDIWARIGTLSRCHISLDSKWWLEINPRNPSIPLQVPHQKCMISKFVKWGDGLNNGELLGLVKKNECSNIFFLVHSYHYVIQLDDALW